MDKILLTVAEFAKASGLGDRRVREFTHIEGFPAIRIGVKIMIHRDEADRWFARYAAEQSKHAVKRSEK